MKGLVIRQPWIGMILRGEKIWEMRSQPCRHRGTIALIEKGSGHVVGVARLIDDLPPLSKSELRSSSAKHGIPEPQLDEIFRAGWVRPWVLADVVRLPQPVTYKHTSGGSWVNLTAEEETSILNGTKGHAPSAQVKRAVQRPEARPSPPSLALAHMSGPERSAQMHMLAHIGGTSFRSITDADVVTAPPDPVEPLPIGPLWTGPPPLPVFYLNMRPRLELVGICAAVVMMFCMLGFIVHFALGLASNDISAIAAFKWFAPMCISLIIFASLGPKEIVAALANEGGHE